MKQNTKEPLIVLIAKSAMLILYLWSGFFWSGVTIINFYINDPEYSYISTWMLIGSILLMLSLVFSFKRRYILSLPFMAVGTFVFLNPVSDMIDIATQTGVEFTPSFELRYIPIVAFSIISLALSMYGIWKKESKKIEERNKFYNSPTKSILDD